MVVRAHRVDVAEQRGELGLDVVVAVAVHAGVVFAVGISGGGVGPLAIADLDGHRIVVLRRRRRVGGVVAAHRRDPVGLQRVFPVRVEDRRRDPDAEVDRGPRAGVRERDDAAGDRRPVSLGRRTVEPADPASRSLRNRPGVVPGDLRCRRGRGPDVALSVGVRVGPAAAVVVEEGTDGETQAAGGEELVDPVAVGGGVVWVPGVADVVEVMVRGHDVVESHRARPGPADLTDLCRDAGRIRASAGGVERRLANVDEERLAGRTHDELAIPLLDIEPVHVHLTVGPGPRGGAGDRAGGASGCAGGGDEADGRDEERGEQRAGRDGEHVDRLFLPVLRRRSPE